MRKRVALVVALLMFVAAIFPVYGVAQTDKELTQVIQTVKEKIEIPESFHKFNYNIQYESNKKIWSLSWRGKDESEGSIGVQVGSDGRIYRYNFYKPYREEDYAKKLPKISKKEAKETAEAFIKKIDEQVFNEVKAVEKENRYLGSPVHSFGYVRMVQGIPFYNNGVSVEVNHESGDIQSYHCRWDDTVTFPSPEKIIALEEAQNAYKEQLGLQMIYKYTIEEEQVRTYAVYTPKYDLNQCIDAFTGKKLDMGTMGWYGKDQAMFDGNAVKELRVTAGGYAGVETLTPEELEAVQEVSKLLAQEEAEAIARDFEVLGITEDMEVQRAELTRDWMSKKNFIWNFYFVRESKDQKESPRFVSVQLDAITGEIKGFYTGKEYQEEGKARFDEEGAKVEVEKFLKEFKGDQFLQVELEEPKYPILDENEEMPKSYSFNYIRKVNGILVPDNYLRVGFDAVDGKITNFHMGWFDVEFPSIDKAMDIQKVYDQMFQEVGLELQYKIKTPELFPGKEMDEEPAKKIEANLVYAVKEGKPLFFDIHTGVILNDNGKPYKEEKVPEYPDIKGHYAENQITALAEYGVYLKGAGFKPEESIRQKDFMFLVSKVVDQYYMVYEVDTGDQEEIENMYKLLIRQGIIKESEKAPDSTVTRENAVKYLIRALKYDKVADLTHIFQCPFKDKEEIDPELVGYVTIAQGLKIVNGDGVYFHPKSELTRAQAAVIIYNYLQR